ncbi:MAG: (2Fe-2S)-binding protein [Chloroflexi bacterium]|nr:(2Fe-2S)-binding protein [Chloroflexota bacterium]MBU1660780.1 (2Fe-2S)-binding protein [Chloroflexota bacterium]
MAIVNMSIDGQKIQAETGQTILQVAREADIYIPVLCDHPALPPEGACRICLVEIEKQRNLQPACTFPVSDGLVVHTKTPRAIQARKFSLELLISDHPLDCMTCDSTGNCLLQDLAYEYGVEGDRYEGTKHHYSVNDPNPFIQVDRNKCILCRRCVRACGEINGVEAISVFYRGFNAYIGFGANSHMEDSPCEFCGSCVAVCPTGALTPKISLGKGRTWQVERVHTTCAYCGVGCQLELEVKDNKIIKVNSAWDGPANHGWTCVKGRFGWDFVHHPDRLTKPRVRRYLLENDDKPTGKEAGSRKQEAGSRRQEVGSRRQEVGSRRQEAGSRPDPWDWVEVDWDTALDITAGKLRQIRDTHGADSIGVMTSAKCLNEENYLMNKFTRQVIGTNNIDHCARL